MEQIWSDEDVIILLDGMINYAANNGGDAGAVITKTALHDSIKDSLHFDASFPQLREKVKELKIIRQHCQEKDFYVNKLRPRARKAFHLAEMIWGGSGQKPTPKFKLNNAEAAGPFQQICSFPPQKFNIDQPRSFPTP